MKLGVETGSMVNYLYANSKQKTPEVGDGATVCKWTDREAGTIIKVNLTKEGKIKSVIWQKDKAKRSDKNGQSEVQSYEYSKDPKAETFEFFLQKNGQYKSPCQGTYLAIGIRNEYYDYSF
jgi:hypothetical protein